MPYSNVVRALYDYQGQEEDEISFAEDDLLCITESKSGERDTDDSWHLAHLLKATGDTVEYGLVPANYVEQLDPIGNLTAAYDYIAQEDNELTLSDGEPLQLLSKVDADWWLVRNQNNQIGLVPSNYLSNSDQGDAGAEIVDNVFEQHVIPTTEQSGHFDEAFPAAKVREKWPAVLQAGKKLKGSLAILMDRTIVFYHGKDKVIEFSHKLAEIVNYDRKSLQLSVFDVAQPYRLELGKSHARKFLEILQEKELASGSISDAGLPIEHKSGEVQGLGDAGMADQNLNDIPKPDYAGSECVGEEAFCQEPPERLQDSLDDQQQFVDLEHVPRREIQPEELAHHQAEEWTTKMNALYAFSGAAANELTVEEGEILEIVDGSDTDWWLVRNATGHSGLVPRSYLVADADRDQGEPAALEGEGDHPQSPSDKGAYRDISAEDGEQADVENQDDQPIAEGERVIADGDGRSPRDHPPPFLSELLKKSQDSMEMIRKIEQRTGAPTPPILPTRPAIVYTAAISKDPPATPVLSSHHHPQPAARSPNGPSLPERSAGTEAATSRADSISPIPRTQHKKITANSLKASTTPDMTVPAPPLPKRPSQKELEGPEQSPPNAAKSQIPGTKATLSRQDAPSKPSNPWSNIALKKPLKKSPNLDPSPSAPKESTNKAKSLPNRPAKVVSNSSKTTSLNQLSYHPFIEPDPSDTRLWKDKSGKFQVEAAFICFENGSVMLHKLNGKKVSVPIELLSERDAEFVHRKCGISWDRKPTNLHICRGFDWLSFLTSSTTITAQKAATYAQSFVSSGCDEAWLDKATLEQLKAKGSMTETDATLLLAARNGKLIGKLEQLGAEQNLLTIQKAIKQSEAQPAVGQSHNMAAPYFAPQLGRPLVAPLSRDRLQSQPLVQPMVPTPAQVSTRPRAVSASSQGANNDLRLIQPLLPQNTLESVQTESQPYFREYSSARLVSIPNSSLPAYQQTTTQFVVKRSSNSGEQIAAAPIGNIQMNHSAGAMPMNSNLGAAQMVHDPHVAQMAHSFQALSMDHKPQAGLFGHGPQATPQGYNPREAPPVEPQLANFGQNSMPMYQRQEPAAAIGSQNLFPGLAPYRGTHPQSHLPGAASPMPTLIQGQPYPIASFGAPWQAQDSRSGGKRMMHAGPPGMAAGQTKTITGGGDKYSVFRQVDPHSASLLNWPSQQSKTTAAQNYQTQQQFPGHHGGGI